MGRCTSRRARSSGTSLITMSLTHFGQLNPTRRARATTQSIPDPSKETAVILLETRRIRSCRIPHDALQRMGWNTAGRVAGCRPDPAGGPDRIRNSGLREDCLLIAIAHRRPTSRGLLIFGNVAEGWPLGEPPSASSIRNGTDPWRAAVADCRRSRCIASRVELLAPRLDASSAGGVRSTVNGVVAVRCA